MSILLLVRIADDMRSAVKAAGEFLVYRRQRIAVPCETDEVLGIWLRRELDTGLPIWPSADHELGAGVSVNSPTDEGASELGPKEAVVGIRASFSLSGLWTLCWIDGAPLREAHSSEERRRRILDAFASKTSDLQSTTGPGIFFPVFDVTETSDSIDATMQELQDSYPQLISGTWFVADRARGIMSTWRDDK